MDMLPILEIIRSDAQQTVNKLLKEAEDRAFTIYEESDLRLNQLREDTQMKARADAGQLADRLTRLKELEDRKALLQAKRSLIDVAFAQALVRMRRLSDEKMESFMLALLVENAAGAELLIPGDVNGGFYSPDFIQKANAALVLSGKAGNLRDSGEKAPNVCGLVLKSEQFEVYCTMEALLDTRRGDFESGVAAILFPDESN
jgi:vacuolar-type H+-ATPase subunit E/Vma4